MSLGIKSGFALSTITGAAAGGPVGLVSTVEGMSDWTSIVESAGVGMVACFTIWLVVRYLVPGLIKNQNQQSEKALEVVADQSKLLVKNTVDSISKLISEYSSQTIKTVKEQANIMQKIQLRLEKLEKTQDDIHRMQEISTKLVILLASQLTDKKTDELLSMLNDILSTKHEKA
jgi:hypothetical protein